MSDDINPQSQAGVEQNGAAIPDGGGSASEVANLKDVLSPVFGTTFKSDEDALKSVEHAKNMAGKVGQLEKELAALRQPSQPQSQVIESKLAELENLVKVNQFYQAHPEYADSRIQTLISSMGADPAKVVESDAFKIAYGAIKTSDEVEKSKSILQTNPRLGVVKDKMSEAREAVTKGNFSTAGESATKAVIEAYDMK